MVHVMHAPSQPREAHALRYERTFDYDRVWRIIAEPRIYRAIMDDGAPADPGEFVVAAYESIWYVLCYDGPELLGCFALFPQNSTTWQVHTILLPQAWGRATDAARGFVEWVWANTPCLRITTVVPVFNRLALRLAEKAGMVKFGTDTGSFLKNGQLYDQILLGISKPGGEVCR